MQPELFTLPNGLRVILIDTKSFPTLTTLLLVGAGSRYENKNNNGVAHFLEHMFYKGSKKYPNPYIISTSIEALGGIWNAFTSKDYTGYFIKGTTEHFEKMTDILSDVLLSPLFEENEIQKEKGVIVEEINMYEDNPQSKVGEIFENLLYKGNSLGMDVIGTKQTVTSFDRSTFTDYLSSLYYPQNTTLVVAGGLNYKQKAKNYLKIIELKFGHWEKGPTIDFTPILEQQSKPAIIVKNKKTEQAHFCLGFRTFGIKSERKAVLSVLATILGVGASSRLFQEVRERKGYCYYIHTSVQYYNEVGNIVTQAGVPKMLDKIKDAVQATIAEHKKIAAGKLDEDELKKAKKIFKGRTLLSMEDSFNVAHFFATKNLLEQKIETPQKVLERVEKVTIRDIVELAKEVFKSKTLNFALIGPFKENDFTGSFDF